MKKNSEYPNHVVTAKAEQLVKLIRSYTPSDALHHEVIKQTCRELYASILLMDDMSEFEIEEEQRTETMHSVHSEDVKPIIQEQLISDLANDTDSHHTPHIEQTSIPFHPAEDTLFETVFEQPGNEKTGTPETLLSSIVPPPSENELSIHEKLSAVVDKQPALADKLGQKIENLKSAISLNLKIAFVNILFKENVVEYAKAIEKLNQSQSLDEALRHFTELKHQYGWESGNELVKELQQLIEKRF